LKPFFRKKSIPNQHLLIFQEVTGDKKQAGVPVKEASDVAAKGRLVVI